MLLLLEYSRSQDVATSNTAFTSAFTRDQATSLRQSLRQYPSPSYYTTWRVAEAESRETLVPTSTDSDAMYRVQACTELLLGEERLGARAAVVHDMAYGTY